MSKNRVYWVKSPVRIEDNLGGYSRKLQAAINALADFIAAKMQTEARENAPWEDRTGNARTGLFGVAKPIDRDERGRFLKVASAGVKIYLSHGHTVEYGKWLELAHGGKYAIIMKTIEANLPEIRRLLNNLFK